MNFYCLSTKSTKLCACGHRTDVASISLPILSMSAIFSFYYKTQELFQAFHICNIDSKNIAM